MSTNVFNQVVHFASKDYVFNLDVNSGHYEFKHEPAREVQQRRKFYAEAKFANVAANITDDLIILYIPNELPRVISVASNDVVNAGKIKHFVFNDNGSSFIVFFENFFKIFRTYNLNILSERLCTFCEIHKNTIQLTDQALYYIRTRTNIENGSTCTHVCRKFIDYPYGIESIDTRSNIDFKFISMIYDTTIVLTQELNFIVFINMFTGNIDEQHKLPRLSERPQAIHIQPVNGGFTFDTWVFYNNRVSLITLKQHVLNIMQPENEYLEYEEIVCPDTFYPCFMNKNYTVDIVGRTCFVKYYENNTIYVVVFERDIQEQIRTKLITIADPRITESDVYVHYGQNMFSFDAFQNAPIFYTFPFALMQENHNLNNSNNNNDNNDNTVDGVDGADADIESFETDVEFETETDTDESDDPDDPDESESESESEEYENVLDQSFYYPQPAQEVTGVSGMIGYIKTSIPNFHYWNEIMFPDEKLLKARVNILANAPEIISDLIHENNSAVKTLQKFIQDFEYERDVFADFFKTSKTIGLLEMDGGTSVSFEGNISDYIVKDHIVDTHDRTRIIRLIKIHPQEIIGVPQNYRVSIMKRIMKSNESDLTNIVTNGVISTMNVMLSQLKDSLDELRRFESFLKCASDYFCDNGDDDDVGEPLRKKMCN